MARKKKELPLLEKVTITDVAAEGKAIAKVDDLVVFVPYVVPGDVVDLQVKRKKNKYIRWAKIKFPFSIIITFFLFSNIGNFQTLSREKKYEMLYQQVEEINIVGIIASEIEEKERIKQCEIEIIAGNGSKIYEGTKLYLQMIDTKHQNLKLEYGDLIQVKGEYKEPEIQRNRNGFDYKRYLKTKNIYGTIEVTENITKIKGKGKLTVDEIIEESKIQNNQKQKPSTLNDVIEKRRERKWMKRN